MQHCAVATTVARGNNVGPAACATQAKALEAPAQVGRSSHRPIRSVFTRLVQKGTRAYRKLSGLKNLSRVKGFGSGTCDAVAYDARRGTVTSEIESRPSENGANYEIGGKDEFGTTTYTEVGKLYAGSESNSRKRS